MTYLRGRLNVRLARAHRRWLHPTSGRQPGDVVPSRRSGRATPDAAACLRVSGTGRHGGWPPRTCPAVSAAGPAGLALWAGHQHTRSLARGLGLQQSLCRAPCPRRTAPVAISAVATATSTRRPRSWPARRRRPDTFRARGPPRTPAWPRVPDTGRPEGGRSDAADGQSADPSLQLPLLFLKAGPAGGRLRRPSSRRQRRDGNRATDLTLHSR
jgi:hypothetical protein